MLQGVTHPRELLPLLGIEDRRRLKRYIDRVHVRWRNDGSIVQLGRERGASIAEYRLLQREAYRILESEATNAGKRASLACILKIREKLDSLQGVSPKLADEFANTSSIPEEILRGMAKQDELVEVAKQFAQFVEEEEHEVMENGMTTLEARQLEAGEITQEEIDRRNAERLPEIASALQSQGP